MLIVDRIEKDIAVCIDSLSGDQYNIPLSMLPEDIGEGSVIRKTPEGYRTDYDAEAGRRRDMRDRLDRLFNK